MLLTSMVSWELPEPGVTLSELVCNDVQSCLCPFCVLQRLMPQVLLSWGTKREKLLLSLLLVDAVFGD